MATHADGRETHEVRYYITSRYLSGKRFAATLLKRHPEKDSIRGTMPRCGYNPEFLAEVLQLNRV